ncbi:uncharacterized protein BDW47DRAFT_111905 [Aspergillus candidus]|uniref:RNA polymerase I-specific transcription initiation factor RRN6-like protein n=1 Tax=Aspergillus candidus TaxID=41067 RepID=A0A2I2F1T2_ASPCN|nr:RNA polymerase I-specific transcription initiation factor RRN6-like protein [Aspergillus candidus]PLB34579.1 RNA polymerase I-specific transcription initiation factor RRN6-like protein [Aspergillus candidus]
MGEYLSNSLQYGHLGRVIYQPESRTWTFSRVLGHRPSIYYSGNTNTTVKSPLTAPQSSLIENKNILPKVYPELSACWPLASNESLSHIITSTSEICDPLASSLLDFGYAVDLDNDDSGNRVVPIAVLASGECGNAISFRRMDDCTTQLSLDKTTSLRVPTIGQADTIEWLAGGAPVRQVRYARPVEEKATWVAARFHQSTVVFRPIYHRKPTPVRLSNGQMHMRRAQNSRLEANPLVEISNLQTGGFAHADVAFNPWYQKQLAIVDQRGNWSLWEITGRHRQNRNNWTAACVRSGSLPSVDPEVGHDMINHARYDGWAVIEWVGDFNAFIVSDRRCPMLYRVEDGQTCAYPIELGKKRKSEWILDVKRSTSNVSHAFILTTSRIFWLEIPGPSSAKGEERSSLYPLLSWQHYRDPEDITLQLSPLSFQEDFYIVLYSRLSHLALVFDISAREQTNTASLPDPFVIEIPLASDDAREAQVPSDFTQFVSLAFREIVHSPSSVSKENYDPTLRLVKLFTLDSRLSVCESLYIASPIKSAASELEPGKDAIYVKKRYTGLHTPQGTSSRDDFIVDDGDESALGPGSLVAPDSGISLLAPLAIPRWAIDYTQVYAIAAGKSTRVPEEFGNELFERGFQDSLKILRNETQNQSFTHHSTSSTLFEILGSGSLLDDIDQNERGLEGLLSELECDSPGSQCRLVSQPQAVTGFQSNAKQPLNSVQWNLIKTYDCLVNTWLSALPHDIPGRTRIMKEKTIRRIAGDLALTRVIMARGLDYHLDESDPGRASNQRGDSLVFDGTVGNPSSEPISGTAPQSSIRTELDGTTTHETNGIYTSLSSHTNSIDKRTPPQSVASILGHWPTGADPASYDWQQIASTLDVEEPHRAARSTTPKATPRPKKLQGQGVNLDSPATNEPPATFTPRVWGSQTQAGESSRAIQSSQVMEEDLPMTQMERGIFGGRDAERRGAAKARKKKRAAGF